MVRDRLTCESDCFISRVGPLGSSTNAYEYADSACGDSEWGKELLHINELRGNSVRDPRANGRSSATAVLDRAHRTTPTGAATEAVREPSVHIVPVDSLQPGDSPRLDGPDAEHVARLADVETPLPPILVDRRSRRVIDGTHRLLAALLKGRKTIEVEFYDGPESDAFLRAVERNVAHGAPLSQADRRAAAARIIESHPHLSDRSIAMSVGLGARTVATVRRCLTDAVPQVHARLGRDGRVRPLSSAEGRLRAAEVIAENPAASLREVAASSGISLATASDVRKRLERGEQPVPSRFADAAIRAAGGVPEAARAERPAEAQGAAAERAARPAPPDPGQILRKLLGDPSLRYSEDGRRLLQLLCYSAVLETEHGRLLEAVPTHGESLVVRLARCYAQQWSDFAAELDGRNPAGLAAGASIA